MISNTAATTSNFFTAPRPATCRVDSGDELVEAGRWEREGPALLGALVRRHQELHDFQSIIEGQSRRLLAKNARTKCRSSFS